MTNTNGQGPRYTARISTSTEDVLAAQRLRHEVFIDEMGARLDSPKPGLDVDEFDVHCDHILIHHGVEVVGTYRLLPRGRTDRLMSEFFFDLRNLVHLLGSGLVEVGRACVHRDHRNGAVISLLWRTIVRYMLAGEHRWMAGCYTVPLDDGGAVAAGIVEQVPLAPEEFRVTPHQPWCDQEAIPADPFRPPALLGGYLRTGAWICGPPSFDPQFTAANFFVLLPMDALSARYLRRSRSSATPATTLSDC